ncbi:MAG: MauE/DoxX family redox-associated membrane protein [Ignavibacteria bacterium]|jgi:uncharacterized membrane protein YphA (DoxX/SURF4 family)
MLSIKNKYLLFVIRIIIAFVFILAGIEKISDPETFSVSIQNYKILPLILINITAIILPWIELITGILLLLGILVKENSYLISTMLVIFILAIGISLARGLNIDCGCFGTRLGAEIGLFKLGENVILLIMSIILISSGSEFLFLPQQNKEKEN